MILIKSQGPLRPIKIKYMTEEGIKVSARPIYLFKYNTSWKTLSLKLINCLSKQYLVYGSPMWKLSLRS